MILEGIRGTFIGDGSIVGAGSVVKGKFLNNVAIAGNSSKEVRRNIAWTRKYFCEFWNRRLWNIC